MIHLSNNMNIFVAINSVVYEVESIETTLAIIDFFLRCTEIKLLHFSELGSLA